MQLRAPAIVCAARMQGETGVVARLLTADHGLVAGYVAGGRGRVLRPVLIAGNLVEARISAAGDDRLPFVRVELVASRAPWLAEPLPAAAIAWATALTAAALPERQAHPPLFTALAGLLEAICVAPSARGWTLALLGYEALLLRELGYGSPPPIAAPGDWPALLAAFDRLGPALARYPLGQRADLRQAPAIGRAGAVSRPLAVRRGDVMAARAVLRDRLARIAG